MSWDEILESVEASGSDPLIQEADSNQLIMAIGSNPLIQDQEAGEDHLVIEFSNDEDIEACYLIEISYTQQVVLATPDSDLCSSQDSDTDEYEFENNVPQIVNAIGNESVFLPATVGSK